MDVRASARFFGGPLDGREQPLPVARAIDGDVITHVFLHDGPKIVTRYRLARGDDGAWEYRLIHNS
ncbi:MAG: hypothetical protein J2O49_09980 [Sciscionella sp.]|nr:hypothetical protein [Sciscionella sp.]